MTLPRPFPVLLTVLLFSSACASEPADDHDHHEEAGEEARAHGDAEEHGEHEDEPSLELASVRGVAFATVGEPRQEWAWFAAEAISEERAVSALATPVSGLVVAFRAAPGDTVRAGQTVVLVRSPELADLEAAWLGARARRERSERDWERERRLFAQDATSRREVEAAEAEAAVAVAEEEAARLALAGRGVEPGSAGALYPVTAPSAGSLASLDVALGEVVDAGRTLGRIVAPGATLARVELSLPAPEDWLPGATTEVRRSDGRRWDATVEGAPAALAADTRRLAYRLRLAGPDLPLAGTPLEARVPLARGIVLPQTALQQIEGVWGVFVREGEHAELRPVRKGPELGGDVLILEGVAPGEVVAAEGAYLLKALWLKRSGGGDGHDH